jgi:hypothetical protein
LNTLEKCASVQRLKLAATAFAALLLGACATTGSGPTQTEQLVNERLDSYVIDEGEIRHDVQDPEVARLWQESAILSRSGDLDSAKARLQQAITITPRDAVLWSRAAEFELDQNSFLRAENYAAKSNYLATLGDRPLRYRNWLIIKRSREGRGDLLGAREAELESTKLSER